ncbi:auxin-responsive protein SAUR71-like [Magnolia sinica]|uniref:auxin-responsive protein SAUR71-like n=1 Tax=Magnolia sinica TaxID=86752 RepID=UPI002658780E|nr:auxin-responsive protein SAUR71-like [Magnolia sinica]
MLLSQNPYLSLSQNPSISLSLNMKKLIRRLARIVDSSNHYRPLRPDSPTPRPPAKTRKNRIGSFFIRKGHLPVYVGEEMERFVLSAELLNRPVFVELLKRSAQEYGYEQKGILKIPCPVFVFERILEALNGGDGLIDEISEELFS